LQRPIGLTLVRRLAPVGETEQLLVGLGQVAREETWSRRSAESNGWRVAGSFSFWSARNSPISCVRLDSIERSMRRDSRTYRVSPTATRARVVSSAIVAVRR